MQRRPLQSEMRFIDLVVIDFYPGALPHCRCSFRNLRRTLTNEILWRLRTGSPWRDLPKRYVPSTARYNWLNRWCEASVCDRKLKAVSVAYNGDLIMIDGSCVQAHQHRATGEKEVEMVA